MRLPLSTELHRQLCAAVGPKYVLTGDDVGGRYFQDWTGSAPRPPELVVRPGTPDEVSAILRLCTEFTQRVVVLGGLTGMARGGVAAAGEMGLSLDRLTRVIDVDPIGRTATVEAGVTLETVQTAAASHGLSFPLDLGARGSCTVGGLVSTNAGGNRVIRYGLARDSILGLEAVLADGRIVSSLNAMVKNNTGYDLKHLFIGSEGTLGVVTQAVLRFRPSARSVNLAFVGLRDFEAATALLQHMDEGCGGRLSAFEVMWADFYEHVTQMEGVPAPLSYDHKIYALLEMLGGDPVADEEQFETVLMSAMEKGIADDAVLSRSGRDTSDFWRVRDSISEALSRMRPFAPFDISLPTKHMGAFVDETRAALSAAWPNAPLLFFGHVGDNNLHIALGVPSIEDVKKADDIVYDLLRPYRGSISAEHGVGVLKREYLDISRNPIEIDLMRQLKQTLDPNGLLNRDRIFLF